MRFLLGVIVGIGLTVGGAYFYDSSSRPATEGSTATAARPMVNWDVVNMNWDRASTRLRREWDRLAAK